MKKRVRKFLGKIESQIMRVSSTVTAIILYVAAVNVACAGGASAADIADIICKILGGGATVMGGIRLATGFVSYANAQDDANGAEMKKAEGKITAGLILGAVGLVIIGMKAKIQTWMTL